LYLLAAAQSKSQHGGHNFVTSYLQRRQILARLCGGLNHNVPVASYPRNLYLFSVMRASADGTLVVFEFSTRHIK
jgi:hypothetical protein